MDASTFSILYEGPGMGDIESSDHSNIIDAVHEFDAWDGFREAALTIENGGDMDDIERDVRLIAYDDSLDPIACLGRKHYDKADFIRDIKAAADITD